MSPLGAMWLAIGWLAIVPAVGLGGPLVASVWRARVERKAMRVNLRLE